MNDTDDSELVQVLTRMPRHMRDKLRDRAKAIGVSLSAYMNMAAMEKAMREDK